jgi:hypothetical protein
LRSAGTAAITVDTSQRVGIGASPSAKLHINTGTNENLWVGSLGGSGAGVYLAAVNDSGSANVPLNIGSASDIRFAISGTEAARIDSSGRVGIGTTTVSRELILYKASAPAFHIQNSTSGTGEFDGFAFSSIGADATIWNYENGYLRFGTNDTERCRLDSSGRLLVGTSSVISNGYGGTSGLFQVAKNDFVPIGFFTYTSAGADGYCPYLELNRARGTQASPSAVLSGDELGEINFYGHDGSTFIRGASIRSYVDGTPGTNDMPGRLVFSTTADGASSPTERMRITSGGNVGIGVTTVNATLHIGSAEPTIRLQDTTTNCLAQITSDDNGNMYLDADFGNTRASSSIRFLVDTSERARIDSSGRLLVGTSSTSKDFSAVFQGNSADATGGANLLLARGTSSPADGSAIGYLTFTDSNHNATALIQAQRDGGTWDSGASQPGRLVFSTTADGASSPTERMRIGNTGTLYVANTGDTPVQSNTAGALTYRPAGQLEVNGNATQAAFFGRTNDGMVVGFYSGGTRRGDVSISGSTCSFNNTSDYRLKENVASIGNAVTRLNQLKPCRFNFIDEPSKTVDGFLAHEVQAIVPEAITGEKDAVDDDGNPEYQGIDQSKLVPLLTAALQEAVAKIESLETRLTAAGL